MQKKYQVFISSTFRDLGEERQDAIRNVLDLGHIPAGMELFPASDTEQLNYIKKVIDECDYYVLIMGGRYGSLDANGISYTEREYDYAVSTNKIVLAFVHGDTSQIPVAKSDTAPRLQQGLQEFREKVLDGRLVREWTTRENLEPLVLKALVRAFADYPAIGWIRGDVAAASEAIQQANDLLLENQSLRDEISRIGTSTTPIIDGLANLEDTTFINFSYYKEGEGYQHGHQVDARVQVSWKDIFSAIAPSLKAPGASSTLRAALSRLLVDKSGINSDTEVKRADADIVEAHFIALGLLKSFNHQSEKGIATAALELSDGGRQKLIESLAVRKPV
jgi:hypothetical protein